MITNNLTRVLLSLIITSCFAPATAQNVGVGVKNPNSKLHIRGNVKIDSAYTLEFGAGIGGKEINSGKIGYKTFTDGLDIVGAGSSLGFDRKINFFNEGGSKFYGNIGIRVAPGSSPFWVKSEKRQGSGPSNSYVNGGIVAKNLAQSFTLTDSFSLALISVNCSTDSLPVFSLLQGDGYGGNVLFTKTYSSPASGGYYNFDISPTINLPAGIYTFIISDAKAGNVAAPSGPGYAGGKLFAEGYPLGNDDLVFNVHNSSDNTGDALFISPTGSVGINNTQPEAALDVAGRFKLKDGTQGANKVLTSDQLGNASWKNITALTPWIISGGDIYNNNTGNTGIHQSHPTAALHINGNVKIDSANLLEFGAGIVGKEANAGKIGYQKFSNGLDVIGAGASQNSRKIKFWAEGGSDFQGAIRVNGLTNTDSLKTGINGTTFKNMLAGRATIGASALQTTSVKIDFGKTLQTIPSLIATPYNDSNANDDSFSVTIRSITSTGFVAVITHTSLAVGWAQNLKLNWMAWE